MRNRKISNLTKEYKNIEAPAKAGASITKFSHKTFYYNKFNAICGCWLAVANNVAEDCCKI